MKYYDITGLVRGRKCLAGESSLNKMWGLIPTLQGGTTDTNLRKFAETKPTRKTSLRISLNLGYNPTIMGKKMKNTDVSIKWNNVLLFHNTDNHFIQSRYLLPHDNCTLKGQFL